MGDAPVEFQHLTGIWPTLVRRLPVLMVAKAALEDKPGVNGEARPSMSPLDFTPWTDIAQVGMEGAGALAADTTGALKLPWKNLRQVTSGANPLEMSRRQWGQWLQNLGPSIRDKNAQTIGAQLMDEFGSSDPKTIVMQRLKKLGLSSEQIPSVITRPLDDRLAGYYSLGDNGIFVNSAQAAKNVQHPAADFLGTVGHETQHAADAHLQPNFKSTPEILPVRPFDNEGLTLAGMTDPRRVEAYLRQAQTDGSLPLPPYVERALAQGYGPKELASFLGQGKDFQADMGQAYRTAVGNRGFRGNNASLADQIHSAGHFASPISGEMDIAPHHMAVAEAQAGASEDQIHPDWISQRLKQAFQEGKAPQVQVPQMPPQPVPQAASPYEAAASLGVGAGMGAYASQNPSQPQATPNKGQTPNPAPNGDEFENSRRMLQQWLDLQRSQK